MIRVRSLLRFAVAICLAVVYQSAWTGPVPEYEMKAAYLYNFAMFTEWPDDAVTSAPASTVRLCLLGDDNFGASLTNLARTRNKGVRIQLSYLADVKDVSGCHILFVDSSERKNAGYIAQTLANSPVLTISDNEELFRAGLMVGMFLDNKRLAFDVNYTKTNDAKIMISSKLLRVARQVIK